ncbi:MAG: ComF family protein [Firmicutes bacterium]|nr:ComF family protein [Bacillota bacterium]
MLEDWRNAFADLFYPQSACVICGRAVARPGWCDDCRDKAFAYGNCPWGACFLPPLGSNGLCAGCQGDPPYTLARAAAPYQGNLRQALLAFKYQKQLAKRRPLAAIMSQCFQRHYAGIAFDYILPTPLSSQRLASRGYNQSALLAKELSRILGIPYRQDLLLRIKDTPPLAPHNARQRSALLAGAFACPQPLAGTVILLVDDIFTTGATARGCAGALLRQGAKAVYVLTAAASLQNGLNGEQR